MSEKPKKSSKSIAEYEHEISILKAEIDDLKLKLEHMNEILVNMQRARFGQSSEKQKYVSPDWLSVFNEAKAGQDPKAPEPDEKCLLSGYELYATGKVFAIQDGPTHVSVFPIDGAMEDWVSIGSGSEWTRAVKSVVTKWDGVK